MYKIKSETTLTVLQPQKQEVIILQKLRNLTTIWHELLCGEMSLLPQYCQSTKGQLRTVAKIILILFKNPYWSKSLDFVQKIGQSVLVLMMFRQKIGQLMNELKLHCQCFHHKNYRDWKLQGPCKKLFTIYGKKL